MHSYTARVFQVYVDDVLIYCGILRKAPARPDDGSLAPLSTLQESILFTNDAAVVERELDFVHDITEDDEVAVRFIDGDMPAVAEATPRPVTRASRRRRSVEEASDAPK